jgi:hypothetical protein
MAWIYSGWQTATAAVVITAVSTASGTFTSSTDQTHLVRPGDRVAVNSGANIGRYTVTAVSYAPDSTVVSVTPAPTSAVVAGSLVFGPSNSTMLDNLRKHHAEVSAAISAAVGSNGTSIDTSVLLDYLKNVVRPEMNKIERVMGGMFMAGQLRDI